MRSGFGAGMAKFMALVSHKGEIPADFAQRPAPDPAMFGMPTEDDGSRTDPLMGQNMRHRHALRAGLRRAARGVDADRHGRRRGVRGRRWPTAARFAVAERLGTEPVIFPSGHGGFLGGEYGQPGEPEAFAAKLREVLRSREADDRG